MKRLHALALAGVLAGVRPLPTLAQAVRHHPPSLVGTWQGTDALPPHEPYLLTFQSNRRGYATFPRRGQRTPFTYAWLSPDRLEVTTKQPRVFTVHFAAANWLRFVPTTPSQEDEAVGIAWNVVYQRQRAPATPPR